MSKTESAKKALRQSVRRRKKNIDRKTKIKAVIKEFKNFIKSGKTEEAKNHLKIVYKTIDKMAKVKLIKKNKASRIKSRLTKKLPKIK